MLASWIKRLVEKVRVCSADVGLLERELEVVALGKPEKFVSTRAAGS